MKNYDNVNEEVRIKIKAIREIEKKNKLKAKKLEDELIISLSFLVHSAVKRYRRYDNYEDLFQEGMIGLVKAVQKYNANTTFHFVRYAFWWIKARIVRSIKKLNLVIFSGDEKMHVFTQQIDNEELVNDIDPEKLFILDEEIANLKTIINALPQKHQTIITKHYGLNNAKRTNLTDIGKELDMTREGIRQLERRILDKIKNNTFSK